MGAARVMDRPAAWRRARRVAALAALAALLLAATSIAGRAQEDTVRVEWARARDGALVILNAYPLRGGRPVPEGVQGLLIDKYPTAAATRRYQYGGPDAAYARLESGPFIEALGLARGTIDSLVNGQEGSQAGSALSADEWTRLLNRLLVENGTEIRDGTHRVIVRPLAEPVRSLVADDLPALFGGRDPRPVFPHLRSGLIALSAPPEGGTRADSIEFGSVAVEKGDTVGVYLRNYGVRPVETRLGFSDVLGDTAFSTGAVRSLEVRPGDSVRISLAFTPRRAGRQRATLDFLVDQEPAVQVILTGEGEAPGMLARAWGWITASWVRVLVLVLPILAVAAALLARTLGVPLANLRARSRQETSRPDDGAPKRAMQQALAPPAPEPADTSVHQRLAVALQAIQDALAQLGDHPDSLGGSAARHSAGKKDARRQRERAAENLRRVHELERERDEAVDARAALDARVQALEAEKDRLAGEAGTLRSERERLEQRVKRLVEVQTENETLQKQTAAAREEAATLRQQVTRLSGEQEKLAARLGAVTGALELSGDMVSDDGWPETQRWLPELREGGKPQYLRSFEQLVADLTAIFEEIVPQAGEGRLAAAVGTVLAGSNHNAGLRKVAGDLERHALASRLGLSHPRELRTLPAERFYRDFVDRQFRPVIDNIAKLGLYARSRSPEIGMGQRLIREGVDPALLERALALIETRMRMDFGVELHVVKLFEERFDGSRHESASHSTLRHTLPDLEACILRLPPDTIYDITSVGLRSERLGISVQPVVAWVASH